MFIFLWEITGNMTCHADSPLTEIFTNGVAGSRDRICACYQHCCLCYVKRDYMTNTTLRNRLGIEKKNYPMASRILKKTQKMEMIRIYDPDGDGKSLRNRKYLPYWG
jgi:predicted HTH transcriptional regulator